MSFVDEARIFVKAGDGGKGCESFYRDKYSRFPKPDGGDGGRGGDVVFVADKRIHTLLDYRFRQHYKAERGGHASSKGKKGKTGKDAILKVPVGTILRDFDTKLIIKDIVEDGQSVVVARGGIGGRGNINNRTPLPPKPGEESTIHLELKLIADAGLVGFPNAGKSTLITGISKVRSKIASYPFTTKQPILGVVQGDEEDSFIVADLPGLIEGAHTGRGLGDRFLKHAERTKILVHVVDMAGTEGRDPFEDYTKIKDELLQYSDKMFFKEMIIVANKMDMPQAQENLKQFKQKYEGEVFAVSALEKQGLDELVDKIRETLAEILDTRYQ
ncbi:MAG: GTPase ObgE [Candidatus Omnitrophica bacterium]|nr:GTPase ObgE [Candidatus Omnitrophota bacterium]